MGGPLSSRPGLPPSLCEDLSTFNLTLQVPSVCLLEKENLLSVPQMENQCHDHKEKGASKCLAGQRGRGVSPRGPSSSCLQQGQLCDSTLPRGPGWIHGDRAEG